MKVEYIVFVIALVASWQFFRFPINFSSFIRASNYIFTTKVLKSLYSVFLIFLRI